MKIFIATVGTRGDVQPYVALSQGLKQAGHEVMICAPATFQPLIEAHGGRYGYMNSDMLKLIDTDHGRNALDQSSGRWAQLQSYLALARQVKPMQAQMAREVGQAAAEFQPDLVIAHPKAMVGPHLAEKYNTPFVMSLPLPLLTPTAEFPALIFPKLPLGGGYNRATYRLSLKLAWMQYRDTINQWRVNDLGLPPAPKEFQEMRYRGQPTPTLYAYSEHLIPRPADWPATTIATGYWFLDEQSQWQPPAQLEAFLAAGPPPVYIGFGSMASKDAAGKAQVALDALRRTGQRGILATGWGGMALAQLPAEVFVLESAPHDWLFERVAAVVHHGGAGTTAAGLRAGRPTIICPFMADQPFWGERVAALGVGSSPIPQKKLTATRLATALEHVLGDSGISQRAAELGQKLRLEQGVHRAVAFLENLFYSEPK